MKKKCCHVRMLSSNKSCSKDNLDRVIYVQQYIVIWYTSKRERERREEREEKRVKDSSCDTCICYHWRATRQIHRAVSSCRAIQCETEWQAPGRRAKKYGPPTIREVQTTVSEVLGWLHFNAAAFCGCWNGARATGCHLQNRWKTDLVARRVLGWRKSEESAIFQWSNKL